MIFCRTHSSWFCPCVKPGMYTTQERSSYLAGKDTRKTKRKAKDTA